MNVDPSEHIAYIQGKLMESDPTFVLSSLSGATESLEMAFPGLGHFFMEFIQNSDDAKSESMKIEIDKNFIKIFNDGNCFKPENVNSICRIGRSSKTPEEYIGYLGVGFKSVFLVSDCPHIYSGGYQFRFDKKYWDNNEDIPWQLIPVWIDEPLELPNKIWKTKFILKLPDKVDEKTIQKLEDELSPEHLNNRIILFIRNIKKLEIHDKIRGIKRKIIKSKNKSKSTEYEIYSVEEYANDQLRNYVRWLVLRKKCKVKEEIRKDPSTPKSRKNIIEREVLVAFKLDNQNSLLKEEKGTAHTGVFSFLPLKEAKSGLNFLIQSDFITTTGRTDISRDSPWNKWIAGEILQLIIDTCVPIFIKNELWKFKYTDILYPGYVEHSLFEEHINKQLRSYLQSSNVLFDSENSQTSADKLVSIGDELEDLITNDDIQIIYPNQKKKIIHPNCKGYTGLIKIDEIPSSVFTFVTDIKYKSIFKNKAKSGNIEWFVKLYNKLLKISNIKRLTNEELILTDNKDLARPDKVYIKNQDVSIPLELKDNYKIVHPEIVARNKEFMEALSIVPLTEEHIKNDLKIKDIQVTKEKWKEFPEVIKIEKIKDYKRLWSEKRIDIRDLSFLTLKTKSGSWSKPEDIILSAEYNPSHNLENILKTKFLKHELLNFPIEVLSSEFIKGEDNEKIKKWTDFFIELKVDSIVVDTEKRKSIVRNIGIMTSKKYELKRIGKEPEEINDTIGCDMISRHSSEIRYIEVKGRSKPEPDIDITSNELKMLKEKGNNYYIYIVIDALKNPYLKTVRGQRILGILGNLSVDVPHNKWKDLVEYEFNSNIGTELLKKNIQTGGISNPRTNG
ncbi:hypothetical protein METP3_01220 [Methanosarcinales archaeon]|nr:MAG: DUF3883 domain-containing protein [Candidatus Methanoperedens sp.]CAG0967223.1 hypothetical protein METP3_01220 [Methanosarcinales archaeon]